MGYDEFKLREIIVSNSKLSEFSRTCCKTPG